MSRRGYSQLDLVKKNNWTQQLSRWGGASDGSSVHKSLLYHLILRTTLAVSSLIPAPPVGTRRAAFEAVCLMIFQQVYISLTTISVEKCTDQHLTSLQMLLSAARDFTLLEGCMDRETLLYTKSVALDDM